MNTQKLYRSIKIRENGQLIGTMCLSYASIKRYMERGFKLWMDVQGQPVLSR